MGSRACALALASLILAATASAHARLRSSSPQDDAHLRAAPKSLTLTFNENVQLATLALTGDGRPIALNIDRGAAAAREVSIVLPPLADGNYRVQWSALSTDDGHVTKGAFSFHIETAAAPAPTSR